MPKPPRKTRATRRPEQTPNPPPPERNTNNHRPSNSHRSGSTKSVKSTKRSTIRDESDIVRTIINPGGTTYRQQKQAPKRPYKFTEQAKDDFIDALLKTRSVAKAAGLIGVSRTYIHQMRDLDADFGERFREAWETIIDELETSALERATFGYEKPVFHMGAEVGAQRVYETGLTTFMLQALRRDRYGRHVQVEMSAAEYGKEVREWLESHTQGALAALSDTPALPSPDPDPDPDPDEDPDHGQDGDE